MPNELEILKELINTIETSLITIPVALSIISDESAEPKTKEALKRANVAIDTLKEVVNGIRLITSYLRFDIEATRREKEYLKGLLEDKDR